MYWFLTTSTQASSGVGMAPPPMTKAVESDDDKSEDEHLLESVNSADANAGVVATATPIPARPPTPRRDRRTLRYSSSFLHPCQAEEWPPFRVEFRYGNRRSRSARRAQ